MAFALTIASAVASIDGLVTITADSLRRLVRAGSVPTQVLRRRQARGAPYTLPWEGVLPDLAEWANIIHRVDESSKFAPEEMNSDYQ